MHLSALTQDTLLLVSSPHLPQVTASRWGAPGAFLFSALKPSQAPACLRVSAQTQVTQVMAAHALATTISELTALAFPSWVVFSFFV